MKCKTVHQRLWKASSGIKGNTAYVVSVKWESSPLKSWKKGTLNSLIVHTQQMINCLFLRQYKRLILFQHLALILPLVVCAQSVKRTRDTCQEWSLQLHSNGKYLQRNEVPLGNCENLPLLHPPSKQGGHLVAVGTDWGSADLKVMVEVCGCCLKVSLLLFALARYIRVTNHSSCKAS